MPTFLKELERYVRQGLEELKVELSPEVLSQSLRYLSLLKDFAEPLGLTALKSPQEFAVKHFLDSLTVLPFLPAGPILDLGTGAGLPGMIIKIVQPEREVWLVDARKKPISFLTYAAGVLGLKGLKIVQATIGQGDSLPRGYFPGVVSRAVSDLETLWDLAHPLLRGDGALLALKGPRVGQEIASLKERFPSLEIESHRLQLPLTGDERHIVVVKGFPNGGN